VATACLMETAGQKECAGQGILGAKFPIDSGNLQHSGYKNQTTDCCFWVLLPRVILSWPNMLTGAGAQPTLYPLAGHHRVPAKAWKSKETKPKQKLNCVLRRKKTSACSLQAIQGSHAARLQYSKQKLNK